MPITDEASARAWVERANKAGYSDAEKRAFLEQEATPQEKQILLGTPGLFSAGPAPAVPPGGAAAALPPQVAQEPSWLSPIAHQAALAGGSLLGGFERGVVNPLLRVTQPIRDVVRPAMGLPPESAPTGLEAALPSVETMMHPGPSPVGRLENIEARGLETAGALLPAGPVIGARGLATAGLSAVAGETRRQIAPNLPGGPLVDLGLGITAGGLVGGLRSRAAGGATGLTPGKAMIGAGLGDLAATGLGYVVPPWAAQAGGMAVTWAANTILGGMPWSARGARLGALVGGPSAVFSGPAPDQNQLAPQ